MWVCLLTGIVTHDALDGVHGLWKSSAMVLAGVDVVAMTIINHTPAAGAYAPPAVLSMRRCVMFITTFMCRLPLGLEQLLSLQPAAPSATGLVKGFDCEDARLVDAAAAGPRRVP